MKRGYAQDNFGQSQGAGETIRAGVHVVAHKVWHDPPVVKILQVRGVYRPVMGANHFRVRRASGANHISFVAA